MTDSIRFGYFNLVDQDATDITADTEDAFYPLSNIKHPFSTKVYRSTDTTTKVVFDFKTIEDIDFLCIRGHIEDGIPFSTLNIEANATNEWTSPAFTTTMTIDQVQNFGVKELDSPESYRFWRVYATVPTYLEISNLFIGSKYIPERNISKGPVFKRDDLSKAQENDDGQRFYDERNHRKSITTRINLLDKTTMESWTAFIDYVGTNKSFWVVPDINAVFSDKKERFAGIYNFQARPSLNHVVKDLYNTSMTMLEQP